MALWRTDGILELLVDIIALEFHFIQMHKERESDISGIVLHLRFLYAALKLILNMSIGSIVIPERFSALSKNDEFTVYFVKVLISGCFDEEHGAGPAQRATEKITHTSLLILAQICDFLKFLPSKHHACISFNSTLVKFSQTAALITSAVNYLVSVIAPNQRPVTEKQDKRPPTSFKHVSKNTTEARKKMRAITSAYAISRFLWHYLQIHDTEYAGPEARMILLYSDF
jgi:hypothetical protein